jgi:hypothetical protein
MHILKVNPRRFIAFPRKNTQKGSQNRKSKKERKKIDFLDCHRRNSDENKQLLRGLDNGAGGTIA